MKESRVNHIGLGKLTLYENFMPFTFHFFKAALAMCRVVATSQLVNRILLYILRFSSLEFVCFFPRLSNKFVTLYICALSGLCPKTYIYFTWSHAFHISSVWSIHCYFSSFLYTHLVLEMLNQNYIIYCVLSRACSRYIILILINFRHKY